MNRENQPRKRKRDFPKNKVTLYAGMRTEMCERSSSIQVEQHSLIATVKGVHGKGTLVIG